MAKVSAVQMLFYLTLLVLTAENGDAKTAAHEREKRHLNWSGYQIHSSSSSYQDLTISSYKPHPKSDQVNDNEDYMAFVLYNGGIGTFHFVLSSKAEESKGKCPRPMMHAGAYRYIYGKCPEDNSNLVAAGYCIRHATLGFNSGTFNDKTMPYLNKAYYENTDRTVNPTEQKYLRNCYNTWRNAGFPLDPSWSCTPSSEVPLALSAGGVMVSDEVDFCGTAYSSKTGSMRQSVFLVAMAIVLNSVIFVF